MVKPFAVVFAGVPGSSKSIITNYLSVKFALPVFSNDQLRFEVKEDMMSDDINRPDVLSEYERRYVERFEELLATGNSMILDGSIDRRWAQIKKQLIDHDYYWFVIDMELSSTFLIKLFVATGRPKFLSQLPSYLKQHKEFMNKYSADISLKLTDGDFKGRLKLTERGLRTFIKSLKKV